MGKVLALLLTILSALASVAGSLFLTAKITDGERQIAAGQKEFGEKLPLLEQGKAQLEAGKRELSEGKKEYKHAQKNPFLVLVDKLFKGGRGFKDAQKRITEGDQRVATGEDQVKAGEQRRDAGELEMLLGAEQLRLAKEARVACAFGGAFFACLSIVLGFCWRRSLARSFLHAGA